MRAVPLKEKPETAKPDRPVRLDSTLSKGLQILEALAKSKTARA